jgi:hypothetical protein
MVSYSALSEIMVVIDPAPAIIGKASGTIDAVLLGVHHRL